MKEPIVYGIPVSRKFAEDLSRIGNVRSIFASPLYPFPGAPYWVEFLTALHEADPTLAKAVKSSDILEEEFLVRSLQNVAHLMPDGASKKERPSFEELLEAKEKISSILGKGIQFTKSF